MRLLQALGCLLCIPLSAEVIGIIGNGSAFLVDSSSSVSQVLGIPGVSVAINNSGFSVVEGGGAFLVSPSGMVTPYSNNGTYPGTYLSASINESGNSVVAGYGGGGYPLLVTANSIGNAVGPGFLSVSCSGPIAGRGAFSSAAINSLDWVLAGGNAGQNANDGLYVVQLAPGTSIPTEVICDWTFNSASNIYGVDLNDPGQAIAGGFLNGNAYTAFFNVPFSGPVNSAPTVTFPFATGGKILSVSINESGTSLIGGLDNNSAAYAVFLQPGQLEASASLTPLPTSGQINSVDITDGFGFGIIGGQNLTSGGSAYAAYVDAKGVVHPISGLPTGANATINSVSMNEWGIALIGGTTDGTTAYAALVNPSTGVTQLNVTGPPVLSVSIRNFQSAPDFVHPHLTGNNLIFAKYILQYARKKALYFSPSLFNGTLADALESAAPTRNALSLFAADNNLFFLNAGLSAHLNHVRQRRYHILPVGHQVTAFEEEDEDWDDDDYFIGEITDEEDGLLAMAGGNLLRFLSSRYERQSSPLALQEDPPIEEAIEAEAPRESERPFTLWGEAIGAWGSQKAQHQTVAFDPTSGGFIFAFEKSFQQKNQIGVGFSYMFTHVHEEKNAGFSNINQECLFVYGSLLFGRLYLDAALWGGLFQTDQERKIHMTGFDFKSTSNPSGSQLDPHLELGYAIVSKRRPHRAWRLMLDPFVMVDWVNSWQGSYKEKGSGPFNAGQKSHYSSFLRTETGFRFYEGVRFDTWVLGFEQKTSYVYKKPYSVGTVKAFLVGSPGSFTVETLTSQQNLGLVELGILFNPINRAKPYGSISYQGEFSGSYKSQQLTLELAWDF